MQGASRKPCAFPFYPWTVQTLGHFFNPLHNLFEYRPVLKKYDLTCHILKRIFGDFQSLIDKQKKVSTISGAHLFNLSPKILWMPKAHQFDHDFSVFILIVDQNEVWDHHRIS